MMARLAGLLLTCGLLAGSALSASDFSGAAEVKKHLAEKEYTLLAFVAPQTEASKSLLQEWRSVQKEVSAAKTVDCMTSRELCQELDVTSFPAIRLYQKDGPMTRYRGPRKATSITSFVKRVLRPAVQDLDIQKLNDFIASDDIVFIAQLQEEDENLADRFYDLADEYYDRYSFGEVIVSNMPGSIWCYNSPDGSQHMATDLDSVGSLKKLLDICTAELIPKMTRRNEMKYLSSGKSLVYYFSSDDADRESYTNSMKRTAKNYQEYLKFVAIDSREYPEMARNLGIRSNKGMAVQNLHNGQVFPYKGSISPNEINEFIVAISEGRVQAWDGRFAEADDVGHDEL